MDWFAIAMHLVAGLVVFLLGVELLARGFRAMAGDRAAEIVGRCTTNRVTAVLSGIVACTVLDSSSATIVMLIAMIEGGIITFVQSLGVVLGANIGTTVGSQIIAFDIHEYAPIALLIGFVLHMTAKSERGERWGNVILGVGLLFFGLATMREAVAPLREFQPFLDFMVRLGDAPLLGALAGGLATLVIQSSSATVGIAILMAMEGLLPLSTGIAVMLGAEIGTVATSLLAVAGRSRAAVRTALFHLFFNASTVVLGLLFIQQLTALAVGISPEGSVARQIANAHVMFNVMGVALFLPLLPVIADALMRMLPDRPQPSS